MRRLQYYDVYNDTANFKGEYTLNYNSKVKKCPVGVKATAPSQHVLVISGQSSN